MKFKPATEGHAKMMGAYISECGKYKTVKYGDFWSAYFRPDGWPNFGNSTAKTPGGVVTHYEANRQAQKSCDLHHTTFGDDLRSHNRLTIEGVK